MMIPEDEGRTLSVKALFLVFLFFMAMASQGQVNNKENRGVKKKFNHLRNEKSPYLLQHATNPVQWYAWSKEAFARAKAEDKPVFLSIGYSTCHWCHVMAHESFENEEVARVLNEIFICIKVDREERPDIDHIYMEVCQILTRSGGWPLTIMMTPDQQPFFAATYLPPHSGAGRIGLIELSRQIKKLWDNEREKVLKAAHQITQVIQEPPTEGRAGNMSSAQFHKAFASFEERFDKSHGGFGTTPKFPSPQNLTFLLHYWQATKHQPALEMVEKTLTHMSMGGIYDHLGFGFHRYATDADWKLPHFEKMLYDQALIANTLLDAFMATGNKDYAVVAEQVFSYVIRDLKSAQGAFFSAEDADSEGEEGKFYLWRQGEIDEILTKEQAALFNKVFNVQPGGNYREERNGQFTGRNILFRKKSIKDLASTLKIAPSKLNQLLGSARKTIYKERLKRIPPFKDDKILTDWNGMMIAALARGSWILKKPQFLKAAAKANHFLWTHMTGQGKTLMHRYRLSEGGIPGFLDDYVFYISGLLELYQASFDPQYLDQALQLTDTTLDQFMDKTTGGFYFNSRHGETLISRQKKIYDGATPSANSAMIINLIKLGRITGNSGYKKAANSSLNYFLKKVEPFPASFPHYMTAAILNQTPFYEIVIAGDPAAKETKDLINIVRSIYLPQTMIIVKNTATPSPLLADLLPFTRNHTAIEGKATVYICENNFCHLPVSEPKELKKQLQQIEKKSFFNTRRK